MSYAFWADVTVAIHAAFIGFVVFGLPVILLGVVCHWSWVRNAWFRLAHLLAICFVALEAIIGMPCPLTTWEDQLRYRAGQDHTGGTFIGRCLHELIFYQAEEWVFTTAYIAFAMLVLLTYWLAPPRWRRRSQSPHTLVPGEKVTRNAFATTGIEGTRESP